MSDIISGSKEAIVSVWCLTYNHKDYIRDALNGFLKQRTDFRFEVFIYDDASDDGTSDIIREYVEKYPELFLYYRAAINKYGTQERVDTIEKLQREYLSGKYIAMCEGDDYWIDPNKIQQQVDYLESHSECVLVSHNARIVTAEGKENNDLRFRTITGNITEEELILSINGDIPSASFLMRRDIFFMKGFPKGPVGDGPRLLFAITKGKVFYENKMRSVYRYMINGSWSNRMKTDPGFALKNIIGYIVFLKKYDKYVGGKYREYIYKAISHVSMNAGLESYKGNDETCLDTLVDKVVNEEDLRVIGRLLPTIKLFISILHKGEDYGHIIKDYISKYERVYLFGNGKYSEYVKRVLCNMGITINGVLISGSGKDGDAVGIDSYEGDYETMGLIVALHPKWKDEVEQVLKGHSISHYYAPFWIEENMIFDDLAY